MKHRYLLHIFIKMHWNRTKPFFKLFKFKKFSYLNYLFCHLGLFTISAINRNLLNN